MTGMWEVRTSFLIFRHSSLPSILGIMMSLMMMSGVVSCATFHPSSPSLACLTSNNPVNTEAMNSLMSWSSSTTRRRSLSLAPPERGRTACPEPSEVCGFIMASVDPPFSFSNVFEANFSESSPQMTTLNTLPFPGLLSTVIVPWCRPTRFFTSASPMPVPDA